MIISVITGVIATSIDPDHTSGIYVIFGILVGIVGAITNAIHLYKINEASLVKYNNWIHVAIITSVILSLLIIAGNINNFSESYEMFESMLLLIFSLSIYIFITSYVVGYVLLKKPNK